MDWRGACQVTKCLVVPAPLPSPPPPQPPTHQLQGGGNGGDGGEGGHDGQSGGGARFPPLQPFVRAPVPAPPLLLACGLGGREIGCWALAAASPLTPAPPPPPPASATGDAAAAAAGQASFEDDIGWAAEGRRVGSYGGHSRDVTALAAAPRSRSTTTAARAAVIRGAGGEAAAAAAAAAVSTALGGSGDPFAPPPLSAWDVPFDGALTPLLATGDADGWVHLWYLARPVTVAAGGGRATGRLPCEPVVVRHDHSQAIGALRYANGPLCRRTLNTCS